MNLITVNNYRERILAQQQDISEQINKNINEKPFFGTLHQSADAFSGTLFQGFIGDRNRPTRQSKTPFFLTANIVKNEYEKMNQRFKQNGSDNKKAGRTKNGPITDKNNLTVSTKIFFVCI